MIDTYFYLVTNRIQSQSSHNPVTIQSQTNDSMDQGNFASRPMVQGNWTCAKCGAAITELPFEPDGTRPVYCRDCHRAMRADRPARRRF